MIAMQRDQPQIFMKRLFYPKWWLEATSYFDHHGNFGPGVILFEPTPAAVVDAGASSTVSYTAAIVLTAVLSSIATMLATMYFIRARESKRHEYTSIPSANL